MNVIFLSFSIILLLLYMLYLARRKDFNLLKSPPKTKALPRSKVEQALKELNRFKEQPKPKSRRLLVEHNSEQFYLERRLAQIQQETDQEQKSYYLACKEREIAWKDYHDFFQDLSLVEKYLSPGKVGELSQLRSLYLDTEKKVELEVSKFSARTRVRHHEETLKQQRDDEIERKAQKGTPSINPLDEDLDPQADLTIQEAFEEIKLSNDTTSLNEPVSVSTKHENHSEAEGKLFETQEESEIIDIYHFGQRDFREKYPDFKGLTYIDERLSLENIQLAVVQDANFDDAYFVSVVFEDRHQYKDCSFKGTDFSFSTWNKAEAPHRFLSCDFTDAKLNSARFDFIAFYNCIFNQADMQDAQFKMVKFVNCSFEECLISNVDFSHTVMSADMLDSIDFRSCLNPPKNSLLPSQPLDQTDNSHDNPHQNEPTESE